MARAAIAIAFFAVVALLFFLLDPDSFYPWIKAIHVIAVISWMAGMLYLPRLFVYHAEAPSGSLQSETFKRMERRLLRAIINPAMIATWLFGLWLAWTGFRIHRRLVARQDRGGAAAVGGTRLLGRGSAQVRRGSQREIGQALADGQRNTHIADDRDRSPGRREAVLRRDCKCYALALCRLRGDKRRSSSRLAPPSVHSSPRFRHASRIADYFPNFCPESAPCRK